MNVLLDQKEMFVEEITTKEAQKGDTCRVKLTYDDIIITIEASVEDMKGFRKNQMLDVLITNPQRTLGEPLGKEEEDAGEP